MKRRIAEYIRKWKSKGYPNGIPDQADPRLEELCKAPSYRMICRAILRNDLALTSLGFSRPKTDAYMELKRIEIQGRVDERLRGSAGKAPRSFRRVR